jgi:hypothetical protein
MLRSKAVEHHRVGQKLVIRRCSRIAVDGCLFSIVAPAPAHPIAGLGGVHVEKGRCCAPARVLARLKFVLTASRQIWSVLLGPGGCDFCGVGRGESWRDRLGECGEAAGLAVYRVYVPFILWTDITTRRQPLSDSKFSRDAHNRERVTLLKVLQTGESRGFVGLLYLGYSG